MLSLIVAMDQNRVIGYQNSMPWHLPRDLQHFKQVTLHHTIIMGRKTYESIGRPLPKRKNIILTRGKNQFPEEVETIDSIETIHQWEEEKPDEKFFIIGGGELYKQMLPFVKRMYITKIHHSFQGDTFFPAFNEKDWHMISEEKGIKDEKNPYDYSFFIYERL